jgi:hypothetical protein
MSSPAQRSFSCSACKGIIYIPENLPPTSAPCPHCGTTITSPAPQLPTVELPPKREIPAPVSLPAVLPPVETPIAAPPPSKTPWFISAALLLLVGGGGLIFYQNFVATNGFQSGNSPNEKVIESNAATANKFTWQKQTRETLRAFLAAKTEAEKARYVIGGVHTLQRLKPIWGKKLLQDEGISEEFFAAINSGDEKQTPPIYLMVYQLPAHHQIKHYSNPLVSMEVTLGAETLDPMTQSLRNPANYETPPLSIHAYFKQTPEGLRIDWDIYLQTRHRSLNHFFETAAVGEKSTFRVIAVQDIPLRHEARMRRQVYRITDPAYLSDSYRVFTPSGAPAAEQLSVIDWRHKTGKKAEFAPITISLQKLANDEMFIEKLVCWEFEGLIGTVGNSPPLRKLPPPGNVTEIEPPPVAPTDR